MTDEIRKANAPLIANVALARVAMRGAAFMIVASVLAACGSGQQPSNPPPVEDTAFGDMVGTMDKARAVEGIAQEHKEALDRTLEQNENASAE
ncbi:MAG TPA: hypothetical protein VGE08_23955 [Steroidobacter sp.]|uniref:hypothetical protein n=1 Tax=Steroidobacter sp. TaxID=1978227 RepID=UPI002ED92643